jgi:hypothetical protein
MGSVPYRICDVCKKKAWSLLGARGQKISLAFELRNSGVPAVASPFQLSRMEFRRASPRLYQIKQVTAYHWHTAAATSPGLYLPKGPYGGHSRDRQPPLCQRHCILHTASPVSPLAIIAAYTYLLKGLKCPGYIYTPPLCTVPRSCTYLKGHRWPLQ